MKKELSKIKIKHFLFSTVIVDALTHTLSLSCVFYLKTIVFFAMIDWEIIPFWTSLILAAVIREFLPYFYHRYSHVGNMTSKLGVFFWKIHSIHSSYPNMYKLI